MDQRYPSTWMLCSQLFMVRFWWALLSKWSCGRYEKLKSIRNIYVNSCEQIEGIVDHVRNLPLSWCADRFIQRAVEYLYLIHWWWKTIDLFQNPEGIFLPHRWWYHKQAKAMVMALASFLVLYATNSPAPTMTFDVMPTRSREFRGSAPEFYIYIYIFGNGKQRRCTVTLFKQIYDCTHRPIFPCSTNMFEWKFNQNVCGLILLVNYLVNFLMDLVYRYL